MSDATSRERKDALARFRARSRPRDVWPLTAIGIRINRRATHTWRKGQ